MRALIVHAHPRPDSFVSTLCNDVIDELRSRGAEVRVHNLYVERFNPVLSEWDRHQHLAEPEVRTSKDPLLKSYVDNLLWCDSLVFVYPTWWSGQPAILKGWLDRVLINGVAWTLTPGAAYIEPNMQHIRRIIVVTTHGSSKWLNALQGESGKRVILRSVRALCGVRCRSRWIAMYNIDGATDRDFTAFRRKVRRRIMRAI